MSGLPAEAIPQDLEKHGFPERFTKAFANAARATQCVILSRTPGEAAAGLIDAGYDLKGFFNKSKSCDWGPMAGFVCRFPYFNKNGVDGAEKNDEYRQEFDAKFRLKFAIYAEKINQSREKLKKSPLIVGGDYLKQAYQQIHIPTSRLDQLKQIFGAGGKLRPRWWISQAQAPAEHHVAIACDKNSTVLAEFLLEPIKLKILEEGNLRFHQERGESKPLFHGNGDDQFRGYRLADQDGYRLWTRQCWVSQDKKLGDPDSGDHSEPPAVGPEGNRAEEASRTLEELWRTNALESIRRRLTQVRNNTWRAVTGAINPFPPYPLDTPTDGWKEPRPSDRETELNGALRYLNAVTGDFDLFAVWPLLGHVGSITYSDLVRTSDRFVLKNQPVPDELFRRIFEKPCAVACAANPRLIIECAPTKDEMAREGIEDPEVGTINGAIALVAGMVNSLVQGEDIRPTPNACFHSDDGANPYFDRIDFPIAMFVPNVRRRLEAKAPTGVPDSLAYLITSAPEFIDVLWTFLVSPEILDTPSGFKVVERNIFVPLNLLFFKLLLKDAEEADSAKLRDLLMSPSADPLLWDLATVRRVFSDISDNGEMTKRANELLALRWSKTRPGRRT